MTLPAFLFGFLVSTLLGAAFHIWKGGGPGRLLTYIGLSWVGFWAGHIISGIIHWELINIGPLHFGFAMVGGITLIAAGYFLSLDRLKIKPTK